MARQLAGGNKGNSKAKGRRGEKRGAVASRKGKSSSHGNWSYFVWGLITGIFISFLIYLGTLPPATEPPSKPRIDAKTAEESPDPQFDFYTILPEQSLEAASAPSNKTATEPANVAGTTSTFYLLQAGSFRQRADADRRRAELLLLGLEPSVKEANSDNGRWYRVYVGPFPSRQEMSRVRSLTANQGIDTLLLKRGAP